MKSLVFVGGFSETIELFELSINMANPTKTSLKHKETSKVGKNPSFLGLNGNGVYCIHEVSSFKGEKSGGFTFMKMDETFKLRKIQEQFSSGEDPTHVILNMEKQCAYISNYSSGHFAVSKLKKDGLLGSGIYIESFDSGSGVIPERQEHSHPHGACFNGKYVYCVDLGADRIYHYEHGLGNEFSSCKKEFTSTPPGSGPRHMVFHPKLSIAYVITELSNEILTYVFNPENGNLTEISKLKFVVPEMEQSNVTNYGAEIMIHPNGKFLYISNRGYGSILTYKIQEPNGTLENVEIKKLSGTWPRHFNIHPSGKVLICADQFKNLLEVFYIDDVTGLLTKVQEIECNNSPSCVLFKN